MKGGHPMGNAQALEAAQETTANQGTRARSCGFTARGLGVMRDTFDGLAGTSRSMSSVLLPKLRTMLPSSFVIRSLLQHGRRYACTNCGEQMFVRYESGLCPLCFNGRRPLRGVEPRREVPHALALVGVLDDPTLEELERLDLECGRPQPHARAQGN